MKTLYVILFFVVIGFALYEQSKPNPNVWIQVVGVLVFFFGMMRLMSKTPSNNKDNDNGL